jgi:hypothetical protein
MVERSTHPMPQRMKAEEAAALVVRKLARRPAVITAPLALAAGARLFAAVPRAIREAVLAAARRASS